MTVTVIQALQGWIQWFMILLGLYRSTFHPLGRVANKGKELSGLCYYIACFDVKYF